MAGVRNVALVHGGFVDGSGWEGVYHVLKQEGFNVSVVQNPTLSLEDDDVVTRRVLDKQDGPTILVGHSYGGAVITEAGTHENVAGLVYIAAFAPDQGESVGSLIAGFPQDGPQPPILPPEDGFLLLDRKKFAASKLVPRRKRRPHDPAAGTAHDGGADRRHGHRDARQSRRLRLQPDSRRQPDHSGGAVSRRRRSPRPKLILEAANSVN